MASMKMLAILLIVGGAAGLAYGGFSYTKETHAAQIGNMELTVKDQRWATVPVWMGVTAIAIGAAMLLVPAKRNI
jgi:hypothetical protein